MIRKYLALGLALAAMGLTACDREDKSPTSPEAKGAKGSARIALPKLPAGYLADSSQQALFSLDIIGPGRDTIRRSTYLTPDGMSHHLMVDGIPVGRNTFIGRLYRLDSTGGAATPTHIGRDSADIAAGKEAQVRLLLRQHTGSAHVCIEVEGWPSDSACLPPPMPIQVAGCYALQVKTPDADSLLLASLRIVQRDTVLFGTVEWSFGGIDSAQGLLIGNVAYLGIGGAGQFLFKASIDSSGSLSGVFLDEKQGIKSGMGYASPKPCGIEPPPPPPETLSVAGCYRLQIRNNGPGGDSLVSGFLRISQSDTNLLGAVFWGSGRDDTATGFIRSLDGTVLLGYADRRDFIFKANVDSMGRLQGWLRDSLRGIEGSAIAYPQSCAPETIPAPPRYCFAFAETHADGKVVTGRLGFEEQSDWVVALVHWDSIGFGGGGATILSGSLDSSAQVQWSIHAPPGLFNTRPAVDTASYQIRVSGNLAKGSITKRTRPTRTLGAWEGSRTACRESDFQP